jgi:hypothetical protein
VRPTSWESSAIVEPRNVPSHSYWEVELEIDPILSLCSPSTGNTDHIWTCNHIALSLLLLHFFYTLTHWLTWVNSFQSRDSTWLSIPLSVPTPFAKNRRTCSIVVPVTGRIYIHILYM